MAQVARPADGQDDRGDVDVRGRHGRQDDTIHIELGIGRVDLPGTYLVSLNSRQMYKLETFEGAN